MPAVAELSFEAIAKLSRDLKDASKLLERREARFLVDLYYSVQDFRIQAAGQVRASEGEEPNRVVGWVFESMRILEDNIKRALGAFAMEYTVGQWLNSITGIGPVISAGLLAHLDINPWVCKNEKAKKGCRAGAPCTSACMRYPCKTSGHFMRFAGLDPTLVWEKKQKRPYNAKLKTLVCYKAGESFVKTQNLDSDVYGKLFASRKKQEIAFNREGRFIEAANKALADKNIGKTTDAYAWYSGCFPASVLSEWELLDAPRREARLKQLKGAPGTGQPMLPPAHIHARARRYAVKMFVSHLHHVMHSDYFGYDPPMPYAFVKSDGDHRHYIAPPNWPMEEVGRSLRELLGGDEPESETESSPANEAEDAE